MICGLLWLPFAVLSAQPTPTDEDCFRWDETDENALAWRSEDEVFIKYAERKFHKTFVKSVTQFYGGLSQSALVDGSYGKGGVIGSSMAVFHTTSCNHRPEVIRVLVREIAKSHTTTCCYFSDLFHVFVFLSDSLTACWFVFVCDQQIEETATSRTFATIPLGEIKKPMDIGNPNMAIYGKWNAATNFTRLKLTCLSRAIYNA